MWLIILICILAAAAVLALYLWAIRPNTARKETCLAFSRWDFAHRGLWNMERGIPENSLPAFKKAVDHGFAIELDVHLTSDGQIVVFHDDTLKRMCQLDQSVESMTYDELSRYRLMNTDCRIPLLTEVLKLVNGRVPLLIELKLPTSSTALCPLLDRLLASYPGQYLIESFNSLGLRWYRKHRPDILRGQLASRYPPAKGLTSLLNRLSTSLIVNAASRPDFVAYNYKHTHGLGFRINQGLFKVPVFVWTVRSRLAYQRCRRQYSAVIFENFVPEQDS